MSIAIYILLGIVIAGLAIIIALVYRKNENEKPTDQSSFSQLSQTIQGLETRVTRNIGQIQESFNSRLDNTAKTVSQLNRELGVVQEMNQQMKDLQAMIKSPKLRGNIGEKIMENLLKDLLPNDYYQIQHQFQDGQLVDAIIKLQDEMIPIDSKFPIENFQKLLAAERRDEKRIFQRKFVNDVRKHIRDISQKYIRPDEGTVNFAVMYIPSETIYYYILRSRKLNNYANQRKVYLTSPNIFHYFIQTIIIGIERNRISKTSRQILVNLKGIQRDAQEFGEKLAILERHIINARKQMGQTRDSFGEIKQKIDNTSQLKEEVRDKKTDRVEVKKIPRA